ncbi:MAG: FtsX-like permease family protein [Candidatus Riflebacteria bacterium]|nr:FtsX-like permease family protein [Candidatus Riflebacteria bacterium]
MKFLPLIWRNMTRNPRRAWITILSLAVPFFLLVLLQTALGTVDVWMQRADKNLRVVVLHKMGFFFDLPESHAARLKTIPGVVDVCGFVYYGGVYRSFKEGILGSAGVDVESFRKVWPEGAVPPGQYERFRHERTGAAIDHTVADRFGFKVGDEVTLKGTVRPVDLKFKICAIIRNSVVPYGFYLHREYLEEALGKPGILTNVWLTVDRGENIPSVMRTAEAMFANSSSAVKVELEKNIFLEVISMAGNVRVLAGGVGAIVVCLILLVAANSIAMSARERTSEVAVMKALGFSPGTVLTIILAESGALGLAAGIIGCAAAHLFLTSGWCHGLIGIWSSYLSYPGRAVITWIWIAPLMGVAAGLIPAALAARLVVADALRRVV